MANNITMIPNYMYCTKDCSYVYFSSNQNEITESLISVLLERNTADLSNFIQEYTYHFFAEFGKMLHRTKIYEKFYPREDERTPPRIRDIASTSIIGYLRGLGIHKIIAKKLSVVQYNYIMDKVHLINLWAGYADYEQEALRTTIYIGLEVSTQGSLPPLKLRLADVHFNLNNVMANFIQASYTISYVNMPRNVFVI